MIDLSLSHVSKRYALQDRQQATGWRRALDAVYRRNTGEKWALRDVSFEVEEGEALGILGDNGAGKSTILKLLSRITAPTSGEIRIRGRLAAMVEVSSGFHPELTGRENVFLNGCMLGMTRAEIARRLESIVEFAGVREYLDVPVKRYSSGMYVRLGFSIAAHLEPDILLLDEVLAVGDIRFQARCLERIAQLRRQGRTIVLISHDLGAMQRLCDRALLLHRGEIACEGEPAQVIEHYERMALSAETGGEDAGIVTGLQVVFLASAAEDLVRTGYPMLARVEFCLQRALEDAVVSVSIYWPSGYLCAQLSTAATEPGLRLEAGPGGVEFRCPELEVQPGLYKVTIELESQGRVVGGRRNSPLLRVHPGRLVAGDFYIHASCRVLR